MRDDDIKKLALALAGADSEKEVIKILTEAGFWDDDAVWRVYGDDPMNYSTIGNQQSSADSALVEKLINSVDAVLMRECLRRGIAPDSKNAPRNIAEAQKQFFGIFNGKLSSIDNRQRVQLAENIFLVATGSKTKPSFSIVDKGEGQTPQYMPETILSLTKSNKIKIPFVQGKFGMGGTGVLRFCSPDSDSNLLLVISKRDTEITGSDETDETKDLWGVTIVRREDPKGGEKSSYYTYLAPQDKILFFAANDLPLLPGAYPEALGRPLESGTYIKLYEYDIGTGLRSLIGFDLYYRLALLMPDVALPIRMTERRRGYEGHSLNQTLAGLSVRLDEDKRENLEPEFQVPSTGGMTVEGQKLDYSIYVFKKGEKGKKGRKERYAKNEGVVFSINGQTHGSLSKVFFERQKVGMDYLSDSILVTVDCSNMKGRKQEQLFMPSRDRLANEPIRYAIERELKEIIKNHAGLKELQHRRRQEEIEDKLKDDKPLAETLESIIKKDPMLTRLFVQGEDIKIPFNTDGVVTKDAFEGKEFPTYFRLVKEYTKDSPRHCAINHKVKIQFATDAENNYFRRDKDAGQFMLKQGGKPVEDYFLNLWNGLATLVISIPEGADVGVENVLCFETEVSDINQQTAPYSSKFWVKITWKESRISRSGGIRKDPQGDEKDADRRRISNLAIPNVIRITKDSWKQLNFNQYSALKVKSAGEEFGYDYYINVDNVYLKAEMKGNTKIDPKLLEAKYTYGMVLLGMSVLRFEEHHHKGKTGKQELPNSDENDLSVYDRISQFTEAASSVLLPMIAQIAQLDSLESKK